MTPSSILYNAPLCVCVCVCVCLLLHALLIYLCPAMEWKGDWVRTVLNVTDEIEGELSLLPPHNHHLTVGTSSRH